MGDVPEHLFERRRTNGYRYHRRLFMLRAWAEYGGLYGGGEQDTAEELDIRDDCEAHGIPMGYGRVGSKPTQLDDYEARAQFRRAR